MSATESIENFLKLPRSTAECDEGPETIFRPGVLTVRYDSETEAGRAWTTLRFRGAIALRVIPAPAISPIVIEAYSKVCVIKNSAWLASLMNTHGDGRLPEDRKHFVVFFDHYGSVETIARTCELEP